METLDALWTGTKQAAGERRGIDRSDLPSLIDASVRDRGGPTLGACAFGEIVVREVLDGPHIDATRWRQLHLLTWLDAELVSRDAEEALEECGARRIPRQRCACGHDPQLRRCWLQAEPVQHVANHHGNLGPRRATVEVELVNDQRERVRLVGAEPLSGQFEDGLLDVTHEDRVEHRVVGHEDVRRCRDHVPPRDELAVSRVRELRQKILGGVVLTHDLKVADEISKHGRGLADALPVSARGGSVSRCGAGPRVATEPEIHAVALPQPPHGCPQSRHLVFDQGVGRIEDDGPQGRTSLRRSASRTPPRLRGRRPPLIYSRNPREGRGFADETREEWQHERFSFARAST